MVEEVMVVGVGWGRAGIKAGKEEMECGCGCGFHGDAV